MQDKKKPPPFTKGIVYPCRMRQYIDQVMDSNRERLENLFPKSKGKLREAKVIIDGWKSCTDGDP
jgi:hypothetical protein